jgi:hypothetical protein
VKIKRLITQNVKAVVEAGSEDEVRRRVTQRLDEDELGWIDFGFIVDGSETEITGVTAAPDDAKVDLDLSDDMAG